MADTKNAHVRSGKSKRRSSEVEASEAKRLLNDPAYVKGFNSVRDALIRELEFMKHDGSAEMDDYEREVCRTLRTLRSTQRAMTLGVQGQALKAADFRSHAPENETKEG